MLKHILGSIGLSSALPLVLGMSGAAPVPEAVWWLPYALAALGGPGWLIVALVFRIRAARKRAHATMLEAQAKRELADGDEGNDSAAEAKLSEAAADRAEADILDAAAAKRPLLPGAGDDRKS